MPAMNAEPGMVKIHAQMMLPATPQRTAESFCVEPTPMIEPVMVWVVAAMSETVERSRDELQPPEPAVHAPRGRAREDPGHGDHQGDGEHEAEQRRHHDRSCGLENAARHQLADAGFRDAGTDDAADQ